MALNIRDESILRSTAERLDELISACERRQPLYGIDPNLAADVTRKAKALRTSLGRLREAAADPNHQPARDQPERETPVCQRLYHFPVLYELARAVNYGGKRSAQIAATCEELAARFGSAEVANALCELTLTDPDTGLTVLRAEVRKACWQLLGPPPEHPDYDAYYSHNGRTPPKEHLPPTTITHAMRSEKSGRGR